MTGPGDRSSSDVSGTPSAGERGHGDWSAEERWWREKWSSRPYVRADRGYEYYSSAYRYGAESAGRYRGRTWEEVEGDLERDWDRSAVPSTTRWADVKDAVRDAWDRVTNRVATEMSAVITGRSIS